MRTCTVTVDVQVLSGSTADLPRRVTLAAGACRVRNLLAHLWGRYPHVATEMIDDVLQVREGWSVLVNGRNILSLGGTDLELNDGDEVVFALHVVGG